MPFSAPTYFDLRANKIFCEAYAHIMHELGSKVMTKQEKFVTASTDMGNVSHTVPSFHGAFVIPTPPDVAMHNPEFAVCASTNEAHLAALQCAKAMATLAVRVLIDENFAEQARQHFGIK